MCDWLNITITVRILLLKNLNVMQIESGAFQGDQFKSLFALKIVNCPIRSLSRGAFDGLSNLLILSLNNVKIFNFEANALKSLPRLIEFMMSDCVRQEISLNNLFGTSKLTKLRKITVRNCNLKSTINALTFGKLRAVQDLVLTHNHIEQIDSMAFQSLFATLKTLHLNENQLKTLPKNIFHMPSTSNVMIYLDDNPWNCDCDLESLRLTMQRSRGASFSRIICASPPALASTALHLHETLCEESELLPESTEALESPELVKTPDLQQSPTVYLMPDLTVNGPGKKNKTAAPKEPVLHSPKIKDFQHVHKFKLQCPLSNSDSAMRVDLNIPSPTARSIPTLKYENSKLTLQTRHLTRDFIYFGYEASISIDAQRPICYGNFISERIRKKDINIQANKLYRFCRADYVLHTAVSPLECNTYITKNAEKNEEVEAWILTEQKPVIVLAFVVVVIMVPLIMTAVSILAIKQLRRVRRRRRSEMIRLTLTPEEEEAISRFRLVF